MTLPYAPLLAAHLAGSRRRDLPFEKAWTLAQKDHPRPSGCLDASGWAPSTLAFAKVAFKEGYYRRSVGGLGILAYGDDDSTDARRTRARVAA